jgi:transposase
MVAAHARTAITFALSPGEASGAKAGRALLGGIGPLPASLHLIMDKAYEDNETRQLALNFGFIPVVPPQSNRIEPGQYGQVMYRKRNEIERLFRRLKGFRRIFLPLRKTRCPIPRLPHLYSNRRGLAIVLTRPSSSFGTLRLHRHTHTGAKSCIDNFHDSCIDNFQYSDLKEVAGATDAMGVECCWE